MKRLMLILLFCPLVYAQTIPRPSGFGNAGSWDAYIKGGTMTLDNKTADSLALTGLTTITNSNALTTGTYRSVNLNQTQTGDGAAILEALRSNITSAVQTGSWANAIVGRIAYSGATGDAGGGLAAAMCSEVVLPAISSPAGSYFAHDFEFDAQENYVANTGNTFNVAYLRFGLYGNATAIASAEDEMYLMHLATDFTDASGNMWYDNTIRIQIETTDWFIPLSEAEGEFQTQYLIESTNTTDATGTTDGAIQTDGGLGVAKKVFVGTDLAVDGTSNLDNTDIDGTLVVDGTQLDINSTSTVTIDNTNTTNGIDIGTSTSGVPVDIGHSTSETTIGDNLTVSGDADVIGALTAGTITSDAAVTATYGVDLGTSQALVGTTALTVGDGTQTVAVNSSDWNIDATGVMTGIGNITSDGTITDGTFSVTAGVFSGIADLGAVTTADINAGTFDGVIGGTTPAAGAFTTIAGSGDVTISVPTDGGNANAKNTIQGVPEVYMQATAVLANSQTVEYMDDSPSAEWTDSEGNTYVTVSDDATYYKEGTKSLKVAFGADAVAEDGVQYTSGQPYDWTADEYVGMWIRSSIDLDANDIAFELTDSGAGEDVTLYASAITANVWYWVRFTITAVDANKDDITEIRVVQKNDKGAFDLYLDAVTKWDDADDVVMTNNPLQDGILSVVLYTNADGTTHGGTNATMYNQYLIDWGSSTSSFVPIGDQSANDALILYAHE